MRVLAALMLCAFVVSGNATLAQARDRVASVKYQDRVIASVDDGKPTRFDGANYHHRVATGARFNPNIYAVAHCSLPLGSRVEVQYRDRVAEALVNDRGPCCSNHCRRHAPARVLARKLDMTPAMARHLKFPGLGQVTVRTKDAVPAAVQMASADPDMPLLEESTGSALDAGGMADDALRYGSIQKLHPFTEPLPPSGKTPAKGLVTQRTQSGQVYIVASGAASAFSGFVSWLESTGYKIKDIGGYAYRRIAGTRNISNHARGAAIDINQTARNRVTQRLPANVTDKAREFGLLHGAVWRRPDTGHFELIGARRFAVIGNGHSIRIARAKRHHYHRRHRVRMAYARG